MFKVFLFIVSKRRTYIICNQHVINVYSRIDFPQEYYLLQFFFLPTEAPVL